MPSATRHRYFKTRILSPARSRLGASPSPSTRTTGPRSNRKRQRAPVAATVALTNGTDSCPEAIYSCGAAAMEPPSEMHRSTLKHLILNQSNLLETV